MRPARLLLVSPWISPLNGPLHCMLEHARRSRAQIHLVTRAPINGFEEDALSRVSDLTGAKALCNRRLHAKLYICTERRGPGIALVGSENLSRGGRLLEMGILIRPERGSNYLDGLIDRVLLRLHAVPGTSEFQPHDTFEWRNNDGFA